MVLLKDLEDAVANRDRSKCWDWANSTQSGGYPQVKVRGVLRLVSHVVLELDGRSRPSPQHEACHGCDRPICFNPDHLRWDTSAGNSQDMKTRRRQRSGRMIGTANGRAKLSEQEVLVIRAEAARGVTHRELGERFGVHKSAISLIVRRREWTHI